MNHVQRIETMQVADGGRWTYLEKRLSMRPAGVVSKKFMGDRKMANAILSCNFRDAYTVLWVSVELGGTGGVILTSIEQNIQRIKVWRTTNPAEPIPKAKYIPIYFPT